MDGLIQAAITVVLFFLILGTLVVIHELGHFITARLAGVRVLEFGIGFPPRAKILRASGETLYTLNWLPIGGFVKLEGEDGDVPDDPRSFSNAPLVTRLVILVAGVVMNLVTAFVIFFAIAFVASPQVGVVAPEIDPGSPAAAAGIRPGDAIIAVNGNRYEYVKLGEGSVLSDLASHAGQQVTLTIERKEGGVEDVTVMLRQPDPEHGALGIRATEQQPFGLAFTGTYATNDPVTAFRIAFDQTIYWFGLILQGLQNLVAGFFANPGAGPVGVTGPVGIAASIGQVFREAGPVMTLYVAGILSANLALVNVLPFPPLDGGRMLILVLKRLFGSRISLRAEQLTYFVGFAFLMAFLLWVTIFDVIRGGIPT